MEKGKRREMWKQGKVVVDKRRKKERRGKKRGRKDKR